MNQKLLLFGVIILVFVGGSYVLGTKNSQPAQINTEPISISPTAVSSNDTSSETSNWKTYTNVDSGYSFKYPDDYQVMKNQKKSVDGVTVSTPNTTTILSSVLPNLNTNIQISIHYENQLNNLSGDEVAKKFGLSTNAIAYSINGKSGFIFVDTPLGPYGSTIIYVITNNKSYTFTIESNASYAQYKQYLDQILSTFKFTP